VTSAIILQARMGSRRLPGKVLADVAGRTILEHCVERLRASGLPVVLATTRRPEDDGLDEAARTLGVAVVRGPDEDVLARFVDAAAAFSLTHLVRATADNPCVDIDAPRRVLDVLLAKDAHYVTEQGLPYGCAVEAVSVAGLLEADRATSYAHDREHVTPFVQRDARFRAHRLDAPAPLRRPDLRLTVDTDADLEFARRVFERAETAQSRPVPLAALIAAADAVAEPVQRGS
jgi:spore coat polysaccharide biosynthesis protein SpsF (cytidylyltransferase family)